MIDVLKSLIQQFMPFAKEKMGFSRPPKLFLRQDQQNADNPMGKTGFYDPEKESITLYVTGRHPKDIMRSLAHELQHHTQKCNGDFESVQNMGEEGYAQADPHMRTMEIQAYQASIVFRDWEDSTKGTIYYEHLQKGDKGSMSIKDWKNEELKTLLTESWGFKMDLSKLNESTGECAKQKDLNEDGYSDTIDLQSRYDACQQDCAKAYDKEDCIEKCMEKGGPMMAPMEEQDLYEAHDKDWDRGKDEESDTRPVEEDYTGHKGDKSHTHSGEEDYEGDAEDPKDLAHELLALAHRMGSAVGAPSDVSTTGDHGGGCAMEDGEDDADDLEERRGRGRKGPHIRGPEDPRLREMVSKIVREVLKGK